jgi:hypothetical protein
MTRWRTRLGDAGAEQMLRATIEAGQVARPSFCTLRSPTTDCAPSMERFLLHGWETTNQNGQVARSSD